MTSDSWNFLYGFLKNPNGFLERGRSDHAPLPVAYHISSGKRLHNYGNSRLLIGKSTTNTSSTAQGSGGSFKNRKPIREPGCCESGMADRIHWWTERCLRSPLFLSLFLTIYLSIFLSIYLSTHRSIYLPIDRSIYLSIDLSIYLSTHRSIYLSVYLSIYLSIHLSIYLSIYLPIFLSIYLPIYLSLPFICLSV